MTTTTGTGKGKYGNRQSLMVNKIDSRKLDSIARTIIAAQYGLDQDDANKYSTAPLVMIRNPKRDAFTFDRDVCVVGTEGVGWECDDVGLIDVPVTYGNFGQGGSVQISGGVIAQCVSDEQVDLADWVRVFGDRLESNFDLWYRIATIGREWKSE